VFGHNRPVYPVELVARRCSVLAREHELVHGCRGRMISASFLAATNCPAAMTSR